MTTTDKRLPAGWTLEEIRRVSGDREATPLDTARRVTGPMEDEVLHPEIVLGFHGLCVVKAVDDELWHMGSLNDDGSIICWSSYDDLREALRGL
ncbi:hypothetical protein OG379_11500 [Streptomyces sp. NBC_01166]|uniref:hypothetical protein n=1 Tax=Streptomyces sp. NBC_01166 TaxID=2903755 RepID=UPI00386997D1|nr:hypothetical protein OG379_11500 [Streptomyces sp. NBC_01166]